MDFDLSPDQLALKDAARALLDRYASSERVRARVGGGVVVGTLPGGAAASSATAHAPHGCDDELWSAMAEQGWLAVERPEDDGGLGLGMVEVAVLAEEIGCHVAPAPFTPTVLALGALSAAEATNDEISSWIDALAVGRSVGCVAWSRDPDAISANDGVLRGNAEPVLYAPSADVAVIAARDGVYAASLEGWQPHPEAAMDRTRELGWLTLDGVRAHRLSGPDGVERLLDRAAVAVSAEMLGAADRALELSVAYAKDRIQFGHPIGSFQAVKHRLADALVDVEGMRSTVYYGAWCVAERNDDEASLAASMAKSWCSDASRRVMASSLQVHGGIGFTWEHDLHLYLKRAQLDQVSFGDAAFHRDRVAAILRARLASGASVF